MLSAVASIDPAPPLCHPDVVGCPMHIERWILEFEAGSATTEQDSDCSPARYTSYRNLQDFVDEAGAGQSPCAVVQIKLSRPHLSSIVINESDEQSCEPARLASASRSRHSRLQQVREALIFQSRRPSSPVELEHFERALDAMSPREWDVLQLMMQGRTCKEMGQQLHIGLPTVAKHRARVLKRFNVRDHIELLQSLNSVLGRSA